MPSSFDWELRMIQTALPAGPRLVVIGSTSFWGPDSRVLTELIAAELATIPELVVLTGGMEGVGLTFGQAYAHARQATGYPANLVHLLPHGFEACGCGTTLNVGQDLEERREVLARVGHVYLVIEGGPGTEHEASIAMRREVPVIPVARTGGHARELFPRASYSTKLPRADWSLLAEGNQPLEVTVVAVARLVRHAIAPYL